MGGGRINELDFGGPTVNSILLTQTRDDQPVAIAKLIYHEVHENYSNEYLLQEKG